VSTQDLDQSTIDSLFAAADSEQKFTAVNFQNRKSLTAEQMHLLVAANQVFGRSTSARLTSWLNVGIRIVMVAAERVLYRDHLEVSDINGMYSGEARFSSSATALVCLDLSFVSAIVHLVLGGPPNIPDSPESRELTAIDATIMNVFLGTLWTELNQIWSSCGLQAEYKSEVQFANLGKMFAQTEYLLVFTYEMKVGKVEGVLQVALPTAVADTLLRELDRRDTGHTQSSETRRILQSRLANAKHKTYLRSPNFNVSVAQILDLTQGSLLNCGIPQSTTAQFGIQGGKVWTARPAMRDGRIVAQIDGLTQ